MYDTPDLAVVDDDPPPVRRRALRTIRAGFIQLLDCALLVTAREKGFAHEEGIDLQLAREASWANIRDRITVGHLDCAHMLAGIPIASGLGLGNPVARMIAPMALGMNGNAITVSLPLFERMAAAGARGDSAPMAMARALRTVIDANREAGGDPLTFGMVYPFSCHNYELRYWLAAARIHPDRDLRLVVIPPPLMVDYMRGGFIDGFCVGAPWNSIAVDEGLGRIVVTVPDLWRMSPEKVLGVRADWAGDNPDLLDSLIRALAKAARWADDPANRDELAGLLADRGYVGASAALLRPLLSGDIRLSPDGDMRRDGNFILFERCAATFPWISHALWIYSQMVRWGQITASPEAEAAAAATYRPDIYRRALAGTGITLPGASNKLEGSLQAPEPAGSNTGKLVLGPDAFFDGGVFDPDRLEDYIAGFPIHSRAGG